MSHKQKIPEMLTDGAVPDGAETMGDDWTEEGAAVASQPTYEPPPPPEPGEQFAAHCWKCKELGYLEDEWVGETRAFRSQAEADSEQHYVDYGHYADIRTV